MMRPPARIKDYLKFSMHKIEVNILIFEFSFSKGIYIIKLYHLLNLGTIFACLLFHELHAKVST